jgi:hypothetical protein
MSETAPEKTGYSYEITVRDHLETHWFGFFEGWTIENLENGEVLLTNPNIDQAGLHGILNRIRDVNLTLLSVNRIKEKEY